MGAISSRHTFENEKETSDNGTSEEPGAPPQNVTPRNMRTLPFDPRSPSGNVNRTPITVSSGGGAENGTPILKPLKPLSIDPRSPSTEVSRTPLLVEDSGDRKKFQPLKPSKLAEISFKNAELSSNKDPRSPTEKVPRTPLEEDNDIISAENLCVKEATTLTAIPPSEDPALADPKINLSKKVFDSLDKDQREPLTDLQNKSSSTSSSKQPKSQVQALQCRNVEEEFTKNEKQILTKFETQDQVLKTATEFVENI